MRAEAGRDRAARALALAVRRPACRTRGVGRRDARRARRRARRPRSLELQPRLREDGCRDADASRRAGSTIVAGPACAPRCWLQSPPASCSPLYGPVRYPGLRTGDSWIAFAAFLAIMLAYARGRALALARQGARPPQPRVAAASRAALRSAAAWLLIIFLPRLQGVLLRATRRRARSAPIVVAALAGHSSHDAGWGGRRRSGAGWSAACSCSSSTSRPRMPATVVRTTPRLLRDFHASGARDLVDLCRSRRSRRCARACS